MSLRPPSDDVEQPTPPDPDEVESQVPGTARDVMRNHTFRRIYTGSLLSNVGRWMQFVGLTAFMAKLTGDASIVGLIVFAQLGPLLFLSTTGGLLADSRNRKNLLLVTQSAQMVLAFVLAAAVAPDDPNIGLIFVIVLAGGCFQAIFAPVWQAVIPSLVKQRNLGAAIALNSVQMNAARVTGPALGGLLFPLIGAPGLFAVNGVTYLFVLIAVVRSDIPQPERETKEGAQGFRKLLNGFHIVKGNPLYRRTLLIMTSFSFFCLPFVGQLPILAQRNLGIDPESAGYGYLYSLGLGLGSLFGAALIGTVLAHRTRSVMIRYSLLGFGLLLAVFSLLRSATPAYPVLFAVGMAYFALITSLSTLLQEHLDPAERGQVMAIWIMAFGGTVPIANLWAGPLIEFTSVTFVVMIGAAWAIWLAFRGNILVDLERDARSASAHLT